jgi:hypothetical protein
LQSPAAEALPKVGDESVPSVLTMHQRATRTSSQAKPAGLGWPGTASSAEHPRLAWASNSFSEINMKYVQNVPRSTTTSSKTIFMLYLTYDVVFTDNVFYNLVFPDQEPMCIWSGLNDTHSDCF